VVQAFVWKKGGGTQQHGGFFVGPLILKIMAKKFAWIAIKFIVGCTLFYQCILCKNILDYLKTVVLIGRVCKFCVCRRFKTTSSIFTHSISKKRFSIMSNELNKARFLA
jgi:hypothetical protein